MTRKRVDLIKAGEVHAPKEARIVSEAPELGSSIDVQQAWSEVLSRLDDDAAHQRFIRACLGTQRLTFALESYQRLQRLKPEAANLEKYVKQVGKMMEFDVLGRGPKKSSPETMLRRPLRMMYTLIIAVVVLLALYATVRLVQHALNL